MAIPKYLIDKEFRVCDWSENVAVDQDVVDSIFSDPSWKSKEGERFLFTSPAVRYDFPYIGKINSWICITSKRAFFWKGKLETLDNLSVPTIHEIDTNTLTRFRIGKLKILGLPIPFFKALVLKGRFFNGNDPSDENNDEIRRERVVILKGIETQNETQNFFKEAMEKLGIELASLSLNTD